MLPSSSTTEPTIAKAPYDKVSESEVDLERYDQPRRDSLEGGCKYILCSTQRSGSYLLCRQLINAGIGIPHEYLNSLHLRALCKRWGLEAADVPGYLREIVARRTTPNGIWGAKLQWPQYKNTFRALDPFLAQVSRYVFLYRSDLVGQAISLHFAAVTGCWGFDGAKTTAGRPKIPLGDVHHVARCARKIADENNSWRTFFTQRHLVPLIVRYEDLVHDQPRTLRQIALALGIDESVYRIPPPEPRDNPFFQELEPIRARLLRLCRHIAAPSATK